MAGEPSNTGDCCLDPVSMPIDGVLDLHTFHARDLGTLVPDYLAECRLRNLLEVRVIHGKGIGNVKRSVHSILSKLSYVTSFTEASSLYGGAGATIVRLAPSTEKAETSKR